MSITKLVAWFKSLFLPRPTTNLKTSQMSNPSSNPVNESAVIAGIRLQMAHLTQLAAIYHDNHLMQWKASAANIKSQTESVVFMIIREHNEAINSEYECIRCEVLMQFSKYDNFFLDRDISSKRWDALREAIIALPSSIGAHALLA